jgi:hypothetical protein
MVRSLPLVRLRAAERFAPEFLSRRAIVLITGIGDMMRAHRVVIAVVLATVALGALQPAIAFGEGVGGAAPSTGPGTLPSLALPTHEVSPRAEPPVTSPFDRPITDVDLVPFHLGHGIIDGSQRFIGGVEADSASIEAELVAGLVYIAKRAKDTVCLVVTSTTTVLALDCGVVQSELTVSWTTRDVDYAVALFADGSWELLE